MNERGERSRKEEMVYRVDQGVFRRFCEEAAKNPGEKYVFICLMSSSFIALYAKLKINGAFSQTDSIPLNI